MEDSPKKILRQIYLIYSSIVLFWFLLGSAGYTMGLHNAGGAYPNYLLSLSWWVSLLAVGAVPFGYFLYRRELAHIKPKSSLIHKLLLYKRAFTKLLVWASSSMFVHVGLLMNVANLLIVAQVFFIFGALLLFFPHLGRIKTDAKLNDKEYRFLNESD